MIDPKHPDRTVCPQMLTRGAPTETGGCFGETCAAFRWCLFDPNKGKLHMAVCYETQKAAEAGIKAYSEEGAKKPLEARGFCGMVPWA